MTDDGHWRCSRLIQAFNLKKRSNSIKPISPVFSCILEKDTSINEKLLEQMLMYVKDRHAGIAKNKQG